MIQIKLLLHYFHDSGAREFGEDAANAAEKSTHATTGTSSNVSGTYYLSTSKMKCDSIYYSFVTRLFTNRATVLD